MNNTKTLFQHSLYYGAVLGVITILFTTLPDLVLSFETRTSSLSFIGSLTLIFYVVSTIYALVLALKTYREKQDGFLSYGTGMNITAWIGFVSALMAQSWNIFRLYVLMPNSRKEMFDAQRLMYEQMGFNDDQIEQQMHTLEIIMQPQYILPLNTLTGFIFVILIGLIVAAILRKEKENPFD